MSVPMQQQNSSNGDLSGMSSQASSSGTSVDQIDTSAQAALGQQVQTESATGFSSSQAGPGLTAAFPNLGITMPANEPIYDQSEYSQSAWPPAMSDGVPSSQNTEDFWNNLEWSMVNNTDLNQPALTNASSATLSEVEDIPAIDDVFDGQPFTGATSDLPMHLKDPDNVADAPFDSVPDMVPDAEAQNRWSLPPSFWMGNSNGGFAPPGQSAAPPEQVSAMHIDRNATLSPRHWIEAGCPTLTFDDFATQDMGPFDNLSSESMPAASNSGRSRPRAIYQKSATLPGDSEWQRFMAQCASGEVSLANELNMTSTADANVLSSSVPLSSVQGFGTAVSQYSSGFGTPFDMALGSDTMPAQGSPGDLSSQEILNAFEINQDYSNPSMDPSWTS